MWNCEKVSRLIYAVAVVAGLGCANAWANPVIRVETGDTSSPIFQGYAFVPGGGGGGVVDFYNPGPGTITELSVETNLLPYLTFSELTPGDVFIGGIEFGCNSGLDDFFFFDCSIQYLPSDGLTEFSYWNDGSATPPSAGMWQGIPPLPAICLSNPDSLGCGTGHFYITLNTDPKSGGDSGDWISSASPGVFPPGGPDFIISHLDYNPGARPQSLAPEPAGWTLTGAGFLALVWFGRRRTKRGAAYLGSKLS